MEPSILRKDLIQAISNTRNLALLNEIKSLFEIENQSEDQIILSDQQKRQMSEAREQYKSNNYLSQDDAEAEIEQWLEE